MNDNQAIVKRQSISVEQRTSLREYARLHPYATQENIQNWFEEKYYIRLSQSAISKSLSDRFKILDNPHAFAQSIKRRRLQRYPEFEKALRLRLEKMNQMSPFSDTLLLTIANSSWKSMYPSNEGFEKKLGRGWLQRFKKRHGFEVHTSGLSETNTTNNKSPVEPQAFAKAYELEPVDYIEFPEITVPSSVQCIDQIVNPQAAEVVQIFNPVAETSTMVNEDISENQGLDEHKLLTFREAIQCLRKLYVLEMVQTDTDPMQLSFYSKMEQVMFERMMKSYKE